MLHPLRGVALVGRLVFHRFVASHLLTRPMDLLRPTLGRFRPDFGPTLGRLLGQLCANFWPTLAVIILHLSGAVILHL